VVARAAAALRPKLAASPETVPLASTAVQNISMLRNETTRTVRSNFLAVKLKRVDFCKAAKREAGYFQLVLGGIS
jgi:hypothetical protein